MKETYKQMKERHQEEFNQFPMFAAFNKEQFETGLKKLDLKTKEEAYHFAGGVFIRKSDVSKLRELFDKQLNEFYLAMETSDKFAINAFEYELGNHEYVITQDLTDTIHALRYSTEHIESDKRLSKLLVKAINKYMKWQKEHGDW